MDYPLLPIEGQRHLHCRNSTDLPLPDVWNNARKTRSKPNLGSALHRLCPVLQYNQHCGRWNLGLSKAPEETTLQLR